MMTHGSLFAGIGGFDEGFRLAGMKVSWQVEIEPFCRAVLRTRFPESELFNDVRECGKSNLRAVDVLTAGFPCQDLSVAGKRAGLAGSRSGLFWEVVRILGELRPSWFVLENVPGLFSSNNGEDFRIVLESLDELGYGLVWRVLDSQFFGVAQRRRRVFIVGSFGKPCPQEVLFESEGGKGDFAESGEERAELAFEVAASLRGAGGGPRGFNLDAETGLTCYSVAENQRGEIRTNPIAPQLSCSGGKPGSGYSAVAYALRSDTGGTGQGHNTTYALSSSAGHHGHSSPRGDGSDNLITARTITGSCWKRHDEDTDTIIPVSVRLAQTSSNGWGISEDGRTHTLDGTGGDAVLHATRVGQDSEDGIGNGVSGFAEIPGAGIDREQQHNDCALAGTLNSGGNNGGFRTEPGEHLVGAPADSDRVRTFTGLPEGLDSARYRALGNAVTAKVAEWIGRRILACERGSRSHETDSSFSEKDESHA
jgi:site-specific DNA-cytosine methylase